MMDPVERVPIEEVVDLFQLGEPLPFGVYDALARLLLNEGQTLGTERQLQQLKERGAWVERRIVRELRERRQGQSLVISHAVRQETLFDRWEHCLWNLDGVLKRIAARQAGTTDIAACVDELVALVDRDADIAIYLAVRQADRRFALYPLAHALHCAVLVLMAARQARWEAPRQRTLVAAALTMNVAMLDLQALMAEQDTPPTQRQLAEIRAHPDRAVHMLEAAGVDDMAWLTAVADHHERADGSGYPRGATQVSDEARLLRMADVYMAKITPRANRAPLPAQQASRQLFQQEPGSALAMSLIKAIGVHPPGSLVQLKSGHAAVVARRHPTLPAPQACTLSDRKGQPTTGSTMVDTHDPEHAIVGPLAEPARYARVLGERVYGLVAP